MVLRSILINCPVLKKNSNILCLTIAHVKDSKKRGDELGKWNNSFKLKKYL